MTQPLPKTPAHPCVCKLGETANTEMQFLPVCLFVDFNPVCFVVGSVCLMSRGNAVCWLSKCMHNDTLSSQGGKKPHAIIKKHFILSHPYEQSQTDTQLV